MNARTRLALLPALLVLSCTVKLDKSASGDLARNQCQDGSECGTGTCWSGMCVAHQGAFSSLLIEADPPVSAQGVGGVRYLRILSGLQSSNEDTKVNLAVATVVHGFVTPGPACAGVQSVPVRVTLTPREESFGLPSTTYVGETSKVVVDSSHPCARAGVKGTIDEFVVTVPDGVQALYDVYVEPRDAPTLTDGGVPSGCSIVPQLLRSQGVAECWRVNASPPQKLDVVIPWPAASRGPSSLDGFTLDVVHPITGEVLSDRLTLRAADRVVQGDGSSAYVRTGLRFTPVAGDAPAKELVRLSPPMDAVLPTVFAERSGLQAAYLDKAVFPAFGPFPAPVSVESWVWEKGSETSHPVPVPGNVALTATKLDGINPGIFATYSTTASIGSDGRLAARLLPGEYRARVIPQQGLGLAAAETRFSVACAKAPGSSSACASSVADGGASQAGKVLSVPRAASITGSLFLASSGAGVEQATVQVLPATIDTHTCPAGVDAGVCATQTLGVLDQSLGEDAFVPRPVSTVVDRGTFTLTEVDCGSCVDGAGALFDLSARPPDSSGFPWLVHPGVEVSADVALGRLSVPLPIVHRGVVEIPQTASDAVPVPNALLRAYVLRDELGEVIDQPAGLTSCRAVASSKNASKPARCIRSVLQVAETRASGDGRFELAIPASLE